MKKLLALLLIAVMCLPLVACAGTNGQNNDSAQAKEYLGKWMLFNQEGYYIEILKDGAAKSHSPDETTDLRWTYNSQMDGILLASNGESPYFIQVTEQDGCKYILMNGNALYHEDSLDAAETVERQRKKDLIDARFADFKEAKFNELYTLTKGVTIKIHEFIREGDKLSIRVSFTNTTESVIALSSIDFYSGFVYNHTSHSTRHASLSTQNTALTPGQTQELTLQTDYANAETKIQYALFGFTFNEEKYYFNISEFVD